MNKEELKGLHALFLSDSRLDWELAAAMCSEEDFEAVMDMEVERMTNSEDFNFIKTRDEDMDGREYGHKLMLGVTFSLFFEWDRRSLYSWACIERFWEAPIQEIAWTDLKYAERLRESTTYWNQDSKDVWVKGPRNQYLTDDFKAELEAVKSYWRQQLKALKAG